MLGNTIVRLMAKFTKIEADCMEALSYMMLEGAHPKEIKRVVRKANKATKKYNMVWKHNVPHKARKEQEEFFEKYRKPYFFEEKCVDECVIDWRDQQEFLKRGE